MKGRDKRRRVKMRRPSEPGKARKFGEPRGTRDEGRTFYSDYSNLKTFDLSKDAILQNIPTRGESHLAAAVRVVDEFERMHTDPRAAEREGE